jgi:hypothetical protein
VAAHVLVFVIVISGTNSEAVGRRTRTPYWPCGFTVASFDFHCTMAEMMGFASPGKAPLGYRN